MGLQAVNDGIDADLFANKNNIESLGYIDSFIPLLIECIKSNHVSFSLLSVKAFCKLSSLPLPSFSINAESVSKAIVNILNSTINLNDSIARHCFKFLSSMMKNDDCYKLCLDDAKTLVLMISSDLDNDFQFLEKLDLLLTIIQQKIVIPEIYDIILKVEKLMLSSSLRKIGWKCTNILISFLMTYPLKEELLTKHLSFVLSNINHIYDIGIIK